MLVSAAVCPHPPLLVDGVGPERDDQVTVLREACWSALEALRSSSPEVLVVVGAGASESDEVLGSGSLAGYGADRLVAFPGTPPDSEAELPPSLCVGAWLLERDGWEGLVSGATTAPDGEAGDDVRQGERIAGRADRVSLLVMADGSARRTETAPLSFHPRAAEYDAAVSQALREGDPQGLLTLDAALAAQVGAGNLNPLRVLAGAAAEAVFDVDILYDAAPYGVGYIVGVWERHG